MIIDLGSSDCNCEPVTEKRTCPYMNEVLGHEDYRCSCCECMVEDCRAE